MSQFLFTFIQDNPLENLNLAFDIAEKYLDIPRMLDPEGNLNKVKLGKIFSQLMGFISLLNSIIIEFT